jgi:alpha-beta hydrolase superfamily lysophospholipase
VHGYGEYCGRSAYFARYFANAGYDFCGFDQRNFGLSTYPGNREHGVVQSWDQIKEDSFNFFDLIDEKFGGKNVNKFHIGYSFGGL